MQINILTLDLEDWYLSYDSSQIPVEKWHLLESRIEGNTEIFLDLLKHNQIKATFFVLGWIAQRFPGLIRKIISAGHEIGYHSFTHQLPVKQGRVAFEDDLVKGLGLLENISGQKVKYYRAPMFSLCSGSAWVIPVLLKHGIQVSSSYKAFKPFNNHAIPRLPFLFDYSGMQLLEMPLNRVNLSGFKLVYSGSGYFRLMPLFLLMHFFERNDYNMTYFHPRDFDANVPSTKLLPAYRNFLNTLGNRHTGAKLGKLMKKHAFVSIGDALKQIDVKALPVVKI